MKNVTDTEVYNPENSVGALLIYPSTVNGNS